MREGVSEDTDHARGGGSRGRKRRNLIQNRAGRFHLTVHEETDGHWTVIYTDSLNHNW